MSKKSFKDNKSKTLIDSSIGLTISMIFMQILKMTILIQPLKAHTPHPNIIKDPSHLYDISIDESTYEFKVNFLEECYFEYYKFKYEFKAEKEFALQALNTLKEEYEKKLKENSFFIRGLEIIHIFKAESLSEEDFKNLLLQFFSDEEKEKIVEECVFDDTTDDVRKISKTNFLNLFYSKYIIIQSLRNLQKYLIEKIINISKSKEDEPIKINLKNIFYVGESFGVVEDYKFGYDWFNFLSPMSIALNVNGYEIEHSNAYVFESNPKISDSDKLKIAENEKNSEYKNPEIKIQEGKIIFDIPSNEKIYSVFLEYHVDCDKDILQETGSKGVDSLIQSGRNNLLFLEVLEFLKNNTEKNILKDDLEKLFSEKKYNKVYIDYFWSLINEFKKEDQNNTFYIRKYLYLVCLKEVILFDFNEEEINRVHAKYYDIENLNISNFSENIPCVLSKTDDYNSNENKLEILSQSIQKDSSFYIIIFTAENIYTSNLFEKDSQNKIIPYSLISVFSSESEFEEDKQTGYEIGDCRNFK